MISSIHPIPAFSDNYIWAVHEAGSNNLCVVDPGDAKPVLDYIETQSLTLTDILITHHHADHTGGIRELLGNFSCRVTGPGGIEGISQVVSEGSKIELFGQDFTVLEVPGHTLDHIAYFCSDNDQAQPILFCGDTLFAAGCGRLFEGTPAMMHNSLSKLAALPESSRVYCTHEYTLANLAFAKAADGENGALLDRIQNEKSKRESNLPTLPSSIELELATNPFLRCNETALQRSSSAQLGQTARDEVEVFAALRAWKDSF